MTDLPKVYSPSEDQLIEVNQEWCDNMQIAINRLAKKQDVVKAVILLNSQSQSHILDKILNVIREG